MKIKSKRTVIIALVLVLAVFLGAVAGVVTGILILNKDKGGNIVSDAFCDIVKSENGEFCFHIPKIDISEEWITDINKKIYDTLYDEYTKGVLAYDGETPAISGMEYEWGMKEDIISITVQINNSFTDKHDFFVFNVDLKNKNEITGEELLDKLGLERDEFYGKIKDYVKDLGEKEKDKFYIDISMYEKYLDRSISDEVINNASVFIDKDGIVSVITEIFDAVKGENILRIISSDTGTIKDYFICDGNHEEVFTEDETSSQPEEEIAPEVKERLEINDNDINILTEYMIAALGVDDFDYENAEFRDVLEIFIFNRVGLKGYYDVIFGRPETVSLQNTKDPLGKFSGMPDFFVMPEENIRWMCENIYHIEYDENYESDRYYVHEGKSYYSVGYAGDMPPSYELIGKNRMDDGRYELIIQEDWGVIKYIGIICDIRESDGRRYMTFYNIEHTDSPESKIDKGVHGDSFSEADINVLKSMYQFGIPDFNCNTSTTGFVIEKCINDVFGPSTYSVYFDDGKVVNAYNDASLKDPEGRYEAYSRLPVENVRWMCENVYNIEFDENSISDDFYIKDGYVYCTAVISGDASPEITLLEQKVLPDGRTLLIFEEGYYNYGETEPEKEVRIIAKMKNIDGKSVCSIYDVKNKDLR